MCIALLEASIQRNDGERCHGTFSCANKPVAGTAIPHHEKAMHGWGKVFKSEYGMDRSLSPGKTREHVRTPFGLGYPS
jgi:hypothetical protein